MITLLASIIGFFTGAIPKVMEIYQDKQDKAHELAMFELQMKAMDKQHEYMVDNSALEADTAQQKEIYKTYSVGIDWIDGLNGLVRPVITLAFFALYCYIKYLQYLSLAGAPVSVIADILWSIEDQSIFASVIAFYFGKRSFDKLLEFRNR